MKTGVAVIDYGQSNILSLCRAIEYCGATVRIIEDNRDVGEVSHLVLPGVGSFIYGMEQIRKRGLNELFHRHVEKGSPLLGICLGMELLFQESSEIRKHAGLGIVSGKVLPLPKTRQDGSSLCVPHISWNVVLPFGPRSWEQSALFTELKRGSFCYFAHSFHCAPSESGVAVAITPFGDSHFISAIQENNVLGVQFHPEKSAETGLEILRKFIAL